MLRGASSWGGAGGLVALEGKLGVPSAGMGGELNPIVFVPLGVRCVDFLMEGEAWNLLSHVEYGGPVSSLFVWMEYGVWILRTHASQG